MIVKNNNKCANAVQFNSEMEELLKQAEERDFLWTNSQFDVKFIFCKFKPIFDKVIEVAEKHNIIYKASRNINEDLNITPFDHIGSYNIALYDFDRVNHIFEVIEDKAKDRGWDSYSVAYHFNSGVFICMRAYNIDRFLCNIKDFEFVSSYFDEDLLNVEYVNYQDGNYRVSNVKERKNKKLEYECRNRDCQSFVNSF